MEKNTEATEKASIRLTREEYVERVNQVNEHADEICLIKGIHSYDGPAEHHPFGQRTWGIGRYRKISVPNERDWELLGINWDERNQIKLNPHIGNTGGFYIVNPRGSGSQLAQIITPAKKAIYFSDAQISTPGAKIIYDNQKLSKPWDNRTESIEDLKEWHATPENMESDLIRRIFSIWGIELREPKS